MFFSQRLRGNREEGNVLVLSRRRDEQIVIGNTRVVIVDIRGDKVRLGIVAPSDIAVHRQEIEEAIKQERAQKGEPPMQSVAYPAALYQGTALVLSRKKNESVVINHEVTVVVVEIRGDKVRLGVEAPKEVPVHRLEVLEAILRQPPPAEAPPQTP